MHTLRFVFLKALPTTFVSLIVELETMKTVRDLLAKLKQSQEDGNSG